MAVFRLEPAVCQQGSNRSVCLSILPSTPCVFNSSLPLYKSTVAPGQSLGVARNFSNGDEGVNYKHTVVQDGWYSKDCECV